MARPVVFLGALLAALGAAVSSFAQEKGKKIDLDALAKQTGVYSIVFEAPGGFQYIYPDQRLKKNLRLDVGGSSFVSKYVKEKPLERAIGQTGALDVARTVARTASSLRSEGKVASAYFLNRFVLATVLPSDDFAGTDIITYNIWALRSSMEMADPQMAPRRIGSLFMRGGDVVRTGDRADSVYKPLFDLIAADAVIFHGLLSKDSRYSEQAQKDDISLRLLKIHRRIAELAGKPSMFASQASWILGTKEVDSIPIGWIVPTAEDLATRDLQDMLAAEGRIAGVDHGFGRVWQLYGTLRSRIHEVEDVEELAFVLHVAKSKYATLRARAVAGGGSFGHSISLFTISGYLQGFGRDLTSVYWNIGARKEALGLAEDMQSRAVTDWLARAHASKRLMFRPNLAGSMGEIEPASVEEIIDVARNRQGPILYYFKGSASYVLWVVFPDGRIENLPLQFDRPDLSLVLQAFPYGSEDSPVAASVRGTRASSGLNLGQVYVEAEKKWLAELRKKIIPDEILEKLSQYTKLLVVPDGLLNFVPFAALVDNEGKYLIDRFSIVLSPSVTARLVLEQSAEARRNIRKPSLIDVHAVPGQEAPREIEIVRGGKRKTITFEPLTGAAEELTRVSGILRAKVDPDIPVASDGYVPVVHLATHGFFNVDEPLSSFVILRKGELYARELYLGDRPLEIGLVVMSACQTGLGLLHADSLIGLRNGFLVTGAQSVVATLWLISDAATVEFMDHFYRGLKEGVSIEDALRNAQLTLKSQMKYADPKFWAPFQLTGLERNPL